MAHDQTHQVVDDGERRHFFQHAWHGFAVQHVHLHGGLKLRQRGLHLPALAVEVGDTGFVKLLRLRRPSGTQVPLPGPTHPLGSPLRASHFGPTLESIPHLFAVRAMLTTDATAGESVGQWVQTQTENAGHDPLT